MSKIDKNQFLLFSRQGLTGHQIAQKLGVSDAAVSKMKRICNVELAKSGFSQLLANPEYVMDGPKLLNLVIQKSLMLLADWEKQYQGRNGEPAASPESNVPAAPGPSDSKLSVPPSPAADEKPRDPVGPGLRIMAEIRAQIQTSLEIYKVIFDARSVAEFQRQVIEVIESVDPALREQLLSRLREARGIDLLTLPTQGGRL